MEQKVEMLGEMLRSQRRTLDYAVMQLEREAKFMPAWDGKNARFLRGFEAVKQARDALEMMESCVAAMSRQL